MMHARDAKTGKRKGTKGHGYLAKDPMGHEVSGFISGEAHPGSWEARTGYTKENRIGGSSKSTKVSIHGKSG